MPNKRQRKTTPQPVDPRALVERLNQEGKQLLEREIIAPLLPGGRIRTRLGGLVYEFKARERFVGWGRFRPLNEREALPLGEALPWERGAYLELFPLLRVILLWPDTSGRYPGTWLALPYNESDARQRFHLAMEPLPVFLCDPTAGAERFERVLVRVDGRTLWFEGPDLLADPTHAERLREAASQENDAHTQTSLAHSEHAPTSTNLADMEQQDIRARLASQEHGDALGGLAHSERLALLYWRIRQLELELPGAARLSEQIARQSHQEQREWLARQRRQLALQENLRHALAKADATLHSFSEVVAPDGSSAQLVVEWSQHGSTRRYRSALDPRLTVVSSGICLSGQDRHFDLTSLVSVMADSPGWTHCDER